jgi:hypothetical protein
MFAVLVSLARTSDFLNRNRKKREKERKKKAQ